MIGSRFRIHRALFAMPMVLAVSSLGGIATLTAASAATPHPDYIRVLAGSHRYVIYELTHDPHTGTIPPTVAPYTLIARKVDGTSRSFAVPTDSLAAWSISGTMLTARGDDYDDQGRPVDRKRVHWWNLKTGQTGTLTLPMSKYLSAYPDGALYLTKRGVLHELATDGSSTAVSRPFHKRPLDARGYSNGVGVVVSGGFGGKARYLTFAEPRHVQDLRTGNADVVTCFGLSAKYAACATHRSERTSHAALISLIGRAPLFAHDRHERFGVFGLIGSRKLAWTRWNSAHKETTVVATLTAPSGRRTAGSHGRRLYATPDASVNAYGVYMITTADHHRLLSTTNGRTFTVVLTAPRS